MSRLDKAFLQAPEETTLEGRVEILGDFPRDKFTEAGGVKHCGLLLKTDAGRLIIHLGPAGYFMQNNFQIRAGRHPGGHRGQGDAGPGARHPGPGSEKPAPAA